MNLGVFIGNICDAPVDVIATSTGPRLDLMLGTSGAVQQRGGLALKEACDNLLEHEATLSGKDQFPPGAAHTTVAGDLPFHAIIHGVAVDAFGQSTDEIIQACTENVLLAIRGVRPAPERVALPIFAADNKRFDLMTALRLMLAVIERQPPLPMEELWLTCPDEPRGTQVHKWLDLHHGSVQLNKHST